MSIWTTQRPQAESLVFRLSSPVFLLATLLQLAAWTQDSFEYRQHINFMNSLKFDSAVCLWSGLDEDTRLAYYNQTVASAAAVVGDFESLKAKCSENIKEHEKNLDRLADQEQDLDKHAKMKSLVIVGRNEKEQNGELYGDIVPFGATYSRPLYNRELLRHREELYDIDMEKQDSQRRLKKEQSKLRASATLAAEAADQSSNEAGYILALQEAVQADIGSPARFRKIERVESSLVPSDKTVNVVFSGPGRVLASCAGRFYVKITKEDSGKVTGIGDALPAYRRFCVVDAKMGDKYTVKVHAEAPISVIIEEVR